MKNEKGITLIALIITIIVMLILVGVTINFALNGGIITKAKEAGTQTQIAADKEALQLSAIAAYDPTTNEVDFTELTNEALKLGFTGSNGVYTKNNITYSVNKLTAQVTEGNGGQESDSDSEQEETVSIAGTYTQYGGNANYFILNSNGQYQFMDGQEDNVELENGHGTYEYNETTNKVTFIPTEHEEYTGTMSYIVIENNTILISDDSNDHTPYTTNGYEGLIIDTDVDITYEGTLGQYNTTVVLGTETIDNIKYGTIVINNGTKCYYYNLNDTTYIFNSSELTSLNDSMPCTISDDNETLTLTGGTLTRQN